MAANKSKPADVSDRTQECVVIAAEQARIEDLKSAHAESLARTRQLASQLRQAEADQAKRVKLARESNLFGAAPLPATASKS